MSAAGWWIASIVGVAAVLTALGIVVGKALRRASVQYEAIFADFDRERVDNPTVQWCCYVGSTPDDAVWQIAEMGETGRRLALLRASHGVDEGVKVARRTVGYGAWQPFDVTDAAVRAAVDGAA